MRQWTRVTSRKPFDLHLRFPRSLCRSCSYGHIPGFAAPARGKRRWTGATPPFCCPVRARGCGATYICAAPPRGGSLPSKLSLQEGLEEERGPGGPVPPDPPVAPEPRAAHIAASEPGARSGGASPPDPPGCKETHTNQRSLQRGIELPLNEPPVQSCHRSPRPPAAPVPLTFSPGSPEPRGACDDGQNPAPDPSQTRFSPI